MRISFHGVMKKRFFPVRIFPVPKKSVFCRLLPCALFCHNLVHSGRLLVLWIALYSQRYCGDIRKHFHGLFPVRFRASFSLIMVLKFIMIANAIYVKSFLVYFGFWISPEFFALSLRFSSFCYFLFHLLDWKCRTLLLYVPILKCWRKKM